MSARADIFSTWLRDHKVNDEADVVAATARGHQRFLRWLILRTVVAVIGSALFLTGFLQLRSLAFESTAVSPIPKARLIVSPSKGKEPLTVTADASSSSPAPGSAIISVRFDFGDGTITAPQPAPALKHTYDDPGTYIVTATVADANGKGDQATTTVTVEVRPHAPRASLSVEPASGFAPLKVVANASKSSASADSRIKSYRFDFGDHSKRKRQKKAVVRHVYRKPGTYRLSVRILDSNGKADTSSTVITVAIRKKPLRAALKVTPQHGAVPLSVKVDASKSRPQTGAKIRDYTFAYGDGSVDGPVLAPRASHTYTGVGTYKITMTVTDSLGGIDQAFKTVKVTKGKPTQARLSVQPTEGTAPLGVTADASKSTAAKGTAIDTYQFDFDDHDFREPQEKPDAAHTYQTPGQYRVTVTVKDSNGDTSTKSQLVTVAEEPPEAALRLSDSDGQSTYEPNGDLKGVEPMGVTADARKSSPSNGSSITSYRFDFHDHDVQSTTDGEATHTYKNHGQYTVTVTVKDANGKTSEASANVIVNPQVR
jgi:PKD repeat protein